MENEPLSPSDSSPRLGEQANGEWIMDNGE